MLTVLGHSRQGSGTHCHYFVYFGFYTFWLCVVWLCICVMSVIVWKKNQVKKMWYLFFFCFFIFWIWGSLFWSMLSNYWIWVTKRCLRDLSCNDPIGEGTPVSLLSYGDRIMHDFWLAVCDYVFYEIRHILLFCCQFLSVYSFVLLCVVPMSLCVVMLL